MKSQVTYKMIPYGTPQFEQLQTFAESFEHKIVPHPNINVYAHYRDDVCFGYSDHVFVPTIYPSFHPAFTRPQDVLQVMNDWRAHCQLSGKPGYIGVPLESNPHRQNFPEKIMEKLGLARHYRELYTLA
jgi:hypothetical protein